MLIDKWLSKSSCKAYFFLQKTVAKKVIAILCKKKASTNFIEFYVDMSHSLKMVIVAVGDKWQDSDPHPRNINKIIKFCKHLLFQYFALQLCTSQTILVVFLRLNCKF